MSEEAENDDRDERPGHRWLQANFDNLGVVRREQEGDDVRYKNIVLIGAGEWTDAFGNTEYYTERALQTIAENPEEFVEANHVDVNHEYKDQLLQVGHIDTDTLDYADGLLTADIVLYGDKTAGKDIIADMDRALESEGENGAGGFSVEIPEDGLQRRFNSDRGLYELTQFKLAGGAIVTQGASGPANFDQQFAERAVAMSDGDERPPVRVLSPGDNTLSGMRQAGRMEPITDLETLSEYQDAELFTPLSEDSDANPVLELDGDTVKIDIKGASIEEIRDALTPNEPGRDMQGEDELQMVAGLIGEFLNENDPDAPASEFVAFVENETDASAEDIQPVLEAYLAEVDAESLEETPVSALQGFVDAQLDEADGGEEPEEDDEEDEEGAEMSAKVDELERKLAEKEETVDDLVRRLEALEDEPAVPLETETEADDETPPADTLPGIAQDGDYISR